MGDSGTALLDGRVLDGRVLDWRQLDGRQLDSADGQRCWTTESRTALLAGRETALQRCWTEDIWTAVVETARRETAGHRCWIGVSWTEDNNWKALLDGRQLDSVTG